MESGEVPSMHSSEETSKGSIDECPMESIEESSMVLLNRRSRPSRVRAAEGAP